MKSKTSGGGSEFTVGCLGLIGALIIGGIWSGYVLSVLWGWFIVPTFELPALSVPVAIGVALTVRFLSPNVQSSNRDRTRTTGEMLTEMFGHALLYPAFTLALGWVVRMFI